jgi:hypothetical protein
MAIQGVNLSTGGALVQARKCLTPGGVVMVHFERLRLMTTATVRHCTPCGSSYKIGMEFRHPLMAAERGTWTFVVHTAAEGVG